MLKLNPDRDKVIEIREALASNDNYCPCSLIRDDNDYKCPCKNLRENEECECGLYVNV